VTADTAAQFRNGTGSGDDRALCRIGKVTRQIGARRAALVAVVGGRGAELPFPGPAQNLSPRRRSKIDQFPPRFHSDMASAA
jgi:hypothetical protein